MNTNLTPRQLAGMIDHTLLKSNISLDDLKTLCQEAAEYGFSSVAINSGMTAFCHRQLVGTGVLCDACVGFPLGQTSIESKVFEARDAIRSGAGEIDYVVNLAELKSGNWDYVEDEMRRIVEACREESVLSKVIFETGFLTDDEKRHLCEIAVAVKPDFVKTSTGFGTGGATLEDVRLMRSCVGSELRVKASGGIRTAEDALAMIEAGADRIGTSAGIKIVEDFRTMCGK